MKTILLIEDDPFLIDIYTTKLKEFGYEVNVAMEGDEAFRKLSEKQPDLILLDVVLPNMDGWEILRKIRNDEKLKDLKVIVLSNLGQKAEVEKGLSLGVIKYLIKSHYTPSQVVAEIKSIADEEVKS